MPRPSRPTVRLLCASLAVASLAACGPKRTSPATQATPKAFAAAQSDAKALEIADRVLAAVAPPQAWDQARELRWTHAVIVDGKAIYAADHAWDRWNGRHHYARLDLRGVKGVSMYDLFTGRGTAYTVNPDGNEIAATEEGTEKMLAEARQRWSVESYQLTMFHKLRDPGVRLKYVEERPERGEPADAPKKYDVIQVTFEPGVGPTPGDKYFVVVSKETGLPAMVEFVREGSSDDRRFGYSVDRWVEVGGLKFATVRENLGYVQPGAQRQAVEVPAAWQKDVQLPALEVPSRGEVLVMANVAVSAEPTNNLYVRKR